MTGSAGTQSYLDHCGARMIEFEGRRERWWNGVRRAIVTMGAAEDWEDGVIDTAFVNRFIPRVQKKQPHQHSRDHFKWNSCSAASEGIYLITINLEQISRVMATCLLFYCMEQLRWTAKWT